MPVTRTVSMTAYAANELTGAARENARDWYRMKPMPDGWDESMKDDLMGVAKVLGFDLDEILCSGFAVQGDGASFTGRYQWRSDWKEAVDAEFGGDLKEAAIRFGCQLEALQQKLGYAMAATITQDDNSYVHSGTMRFEMDDETLATVEEATLREARQEFKDILYFFGDWMWRQLWNEYDAQREDDAVDDALEEMGHIFDKKGNRLRV